MSIDTATISMFFELYINVGKIPFSTDWDVSGHYYINAIIGDNVPKLEVGQALGFYDYDAMRECVIIGTAKGNKILFSKYLDNVCTGIYICERMADPIECPTCNNVRSEHLRQIIKNIRS